MNWDQAREWEEKANAEKQISEIEPHWSFDCGLKLDYDGGLLRVSSRFYQTGNDIYDGSVSFIIGDTEVFNREFSSRHIDVLKTEVEKYVKIVAERIQLLCQENIVTFVVGRSEI